MVAHLHLVWISHIHADHHAGLVRIIAARKAARKTLNLPEQPLVIVAPCLLQRFLAAYDNVEKMDMVFLDCAQTVGETNRRSSSFRTGLQPFSGITGNLNRGVEEKAMLQEALSRLGLKSLSSVGVIHCPQSYGVVIEAEATGVKPGLKLAYSGDTRPCTAFVEASKGATIFIHEVRTKLFSLVRRGLGRILVAFVEPGYELCRFTSNEMKGGLGHSLNNGRCQSVVSQPAAGASLPCRRTVP